MKSSIRIWHLISLLCLLLLISRIEVILNSLKLLFLYIIFLFSDFSSALQQFSFELADHLFSPLLLIILITVIIIFRKKSLFTGGISFSTGIVIILVFFFVFAPLITNANPEFQKDLRVTKLLSPLSSLKIIYLRNEKADMNEFFALKKQVVKESFDNSMAFADSFYLKSEKVVFFQKGKRTEVPAAVVLTENGQVQSGSKLFWLGTDEHGRDIFTRLVYGARISLFVGFGAVIITLILGVSLGFAAGYVGGVIDLILSRISDMLLAFPIIFLIILILALFGNSLLTVIAVLGYSGWMSLFKVVRSEVISIKQKEYFISARLAGLARKDLLIKEIFPVILAPVLVNLVFQFANVILAESALSYLGLGTGNSYPSWGGMIDSGQEYLTEAWWMILFPGLALFLTLYTANNFGKELNFIFNPRLKHD